MSRLIEVQEITPTRKRLLFDPHPGQKLAWDATERFIALIAGSGGGKTSFGAAWLWREQQWRPGEYLAISPTYPMLVRVLVPTFLSLAVHYGAVYHKAEGKITLGQSTIWLTSADTPERAEGIHATGVWLDEAGQMSSLMWEVARRRVAHQQGRILLTTTPYDMGWLKTEVADRAAAGEPEYRVITFPSIENPAYPREEFERARRELSPERFAMFYLGQFRRATGLVYPDWLPATMTVEPFDVPLDWRRVGGLDLGWHHATAGLVLAESPDGMVYVIGEHYARETTLEAHAAALAAFGEDVRWYADPSAAQSIAELRGYGLTVSLADNDVLTGIGTVTRLIRSDRLRVFQGRCPNLLRELESYVWEQRDGQPTDKPRKQDDHAVDGLRYACQEIDRGAASGGQVVVLRTRAYESINW